MDQHENLAQKQIDTKLYKLSIRRSISFFRFAGIVHIMLLFLDMYNSYIGVWEDQPLQYYLFLNHLFSIPILFWFCKYLQDQISSSVITIVEFKKLILLSVLMFFPIIMTYHYIEINTSYSGSALIIYILGYGLMLNLNTHLRIMLSVYFYISYFTIPIISGIAHIDNPYFYMIGLGTVPLFYLLSKTLNESEAARFLNEDLIIAKSHKLDQLNLELNKANQNIQSANQALKKSNKDLSNFASIAAHDIKAPMRTIGSFSSLLTKKYKNKIANQDLEYFEFINTSVFSLSKMIDTLLQFSKISEEVPAQFKTIDLNQLVQTCIQLLESPINDNNTEINIPTSLPIIYGDEHLLKQLFLNLINNAIKFSKNALPRPQVIISANSTQNSEIEISIKDNGIGIKKTNQHKIFDLFHKLNAPADYEGNGIGLALCSRIVNTHQGTIEVESEYGHGAEFKVRIPQLSKIANQRKVYHLQE